VPNEYLCPITMDLMRDPVIAMDGHTYDRKAISSWLSKSQKSPKTNMLLPSKQVHMPAASLVQPVSCLPLSVRCRSEFTLLLQLLPNHALKSMIVEWLERHPNYQD